MLTELLKKIEIKTNPLLIAILVVLITAKLGYSQNSKVLDFAIILLTVYLIIIFVVWLFNAIKQNNNEKKYKRESLKKNAERYNHTNELIWNFFLGLSERKLNILIELINLPEAGSKYKRVVPPTSTLKSQLFYDDFQIPVNFRQNLVILNVSNGYEMDSPTVVDIDSTMYGFVKHYIDTGRKERVS